jgi:hypothetical protein
MSFHRIRVCVLGVARNSELVLSMFASTFRNVAENLIVTKDEVFLFFADRLDSCSHSTCTIYNG